MSIEAINPFEPADKVTKNFKWWIQVLSNPELELKTATMRLFNIGAPVTSMEVTTEKMNEVDESWAIGDGAWTGWADWTTKVDLPVSQALADVITNYTVLEVEDELVVVESVDRTAKTIDVYDRGFGSTTGASHVDTTLAYITWYNYVVWVKDIEPRKFNSDTYNYYVAKNTIPAVEFTKEDITTKRKHYWEEGFPEYVNAQIDIMEKDLLVQMNRSLIKHSWQVATNTTPWMVVGLLEEATSRWIVVTNFGTLSTVKMLNDALTTCRNRGWIVDVAVMSPNNYDLFQELTDSNTKKEVPTLLRQILGNSVDSIVTKAGTIIAVMDINFPDDKIVLGNTEDWYWAPFKWFDLPWADRELAQKSSRNDQAFTVDSLTQGCTYYFNSYRNLTILTGVTQSSS